jgi:hypothetical protein
MPEQEQATTEHELSSMSLQYHKSELHPPVSASEVIVQLLLALDESTHALPMGAVEGPLDSQQVPCELLVAKQFAQLASSRHWPPMYS